jgi:hypothetical protein
MYALISVSLEAVQKCEDTKGVIIIRKSKNRQYNDQKKKYKRTNNFLQNPTHKTKDRVTRTNKTDRKDITEILLKVVLSTKRSTANP